MATGEAHDTDVTIVGAGPTGLLAAALLHRCGVRLRILDKAPTAAKESRAFAVQARSLEILSLLGLADTFLGRGTIASGVRVFVDGKQAAGFGFEFIERADTPYPVILTLPQSDTEAILVEHLRENGVEVERGVTATGLEQDGNGVTLRATSGDGGALAIRSAFLLGSDGAHSIVRKALGLSFEGAPYAQTFLLADCRLDGEVADGPFSAFFHDNHFAIWFPLGGERFGRVITTSRQAVTDPSVAGQGSAPATLEEVEAAFREATQLDVRLSHPVWLSRYRVHHRGVDRYGVGRAFVAGDAAHIHSPAGGQGMNTGLQDAANLAWKLALAVTGRAPPCLLDSYDSERRPVGVSVLKATDRAFSLVTSSSPWASAARNLVVPLLGATVARSGTLRSKAFDLLSELGIRYEPGPAVAEAAGPAFEGGPEAGWRAPDAAVARGLSLFDLIGTYRFHLLAIRRGPLGLDAVAESRAALAEAARATGIDCEPVLLAHSAAGREPGLVRIENGAVLNAYGVTGEVRDALYLVRPDGYIAWRAPVFDLDGLRAFAAERFGAA